MICPSCGQESPAGFRFCGACGATLEPERQADVRKTVTIVFCDLVGSTALGERADPEVLRELMSRYHADLRAILERHGGSVEKFVGDAAMAIFGLPQVHEDDARRAVRAAFELRAAVATLGLDVRIGVNTGEVVAGTGETLATGDAVNVAARLEQAAEPGEILIGAATERLVRDSVRAEAVPPLALKGKSEPVPAFRVLELLHDVPAFTSSIDAPFVGRREELGQLEHILGSAFASRTPHLATIVGLPGIGKSRLVRELLRRAQARVVVGRCIPYGEGITYWPLREIASQVGDIRGALEGSDDAELAAVRIDAALGDTVTPVPPEEIAWGVRRLFEVLARTGPLLVVFDDIHWAEPALLDLIEYVAAFAQDASLLVLCTARPDLLELRATWTAPRANAIVLTLEALTVEESATLAEELGEISDEMRRRIVEVAEGNPLFVEQLVAMQAESGNGDLEIPPTLQALLAARIDRLLQPERAVVERGSIEGRLFHRGAVAALLPELERPAVGTHLLTLVRRELIRPDRATLPGDDGFRFGHSLIRDAAYDSIPKRRRAALHERFADWLVAKLGGDAPDEIVGYHLEQAYRYGVELGSADAELGARAAELLALAGRAALARRDVSATVSLLGRAVELAPGDAGRPGLLVDLGQALYLTGETARARAVLEECSSLARAHGDARVEWLARIHLASIRLNSEPEGAADDAFRVGEAAIAACKPGADHEVLARAWSLIALGHGLRAQAAEWQRALDRAVEHARQGRDQALEVSLVSYSAGPIVFGPVPVEEGLRFVDDALTRFGHVPEVQGMALHVLGHLRARRGEFDGALEALTEWRRHNRELGQDGAYAATAGCIWDVCFWAEDWVRGEEALREAYEMLERMGRKSFLSTIAADLGTAVLRRGHLDEAERLSQLSEEVGASDDLVNEVEWRRVRAKVHAARGDLSRAESLAHEAVQIAAATDFLDLAAGAQLDLAGILQAAGDPEATTAAAEALSLYEQKGNLVGAQRVREFLDAARA